MRNTKALYGFALASFGLLTLVGCDSLRIEQGLLNSKDPAGFRCASNDDCLNGYRCVNDGANPSGVCTEIGIGRDCAQYNMDGDQYLAVGAPEECFGEATDCDDSDPNTYPDAIELCDGIDNNCDGTADEGLGSIPCALQIGVCRGAVSSCVDGDIVDCSESGAYAAAAAERGEVYSEVELCGDGVDNNCDGVVDEGCCDAERPTTGPDAGGNAQCMCVPGQAFACGRDTGTCTRGIQICDTSTAIGDLPCLEADPVDLGTCEIGGAPHGDADVFCVKEFIRPDEDLYDACTVATSPACERTVFRRLAAGTGTSCSSNSDCGGSSYCAAGECRSGNVKPVAEMCNGLDDDCDGSIDNHKGSAAAAPCGACPFNMVNLAISNVIVGTSAPSNQCVAVYEASRPDATDTDSGSSDLYAASVPNVQPWTGVSGQEALRACEGVDYRLLFGAAGSRPYQDALPPSLLCSDAHWSQACSAQSAVQHGSSLQRYPWGNTAVDDRCNDSSAGSGGTEPTGSFPDCANAGALPGVSSSSVKLFDMIGNVMEWTRGLTPTSVTGLRGGSFTTGTDDAICFNSASPANQGFRAGTPILAAGQRTACTSDADCGPGDVCNTVGGANVCVVGCGSSCDGDCKQIAGSTIDACHYPAQNGDWSDFDGVGFRCCVAPLQ